MEHYIIATRDKKLGAYDMPLRFETQDVEHITESFIRSAKLSPENMISQVADRSVYYLGIFDDITGKFKLLDEAEKLLDLEDYVPRKETSK